MLLCSVNSVLVQEKGKLLKDDNAVIGSQERVQLSGSEGIDGEGTQESDPDNFAKLVGVEVEDSQELDNIVDGSCQQHGGKNLSNPRRSSRLKESEEVNVIDKAKERAKFKDLEKGKGGSVIPGAAPSSRPPFSHS